MVIPGKGRNADKGALADAFGGTNVQVHDIVVDGEGGNRSAPPPDNVAQRPSFAEALIDEEAVVGDDVSVDYLYATNYDLIGKLLENVRGRKRALRLQVVREGAPTQIGIAATDQHKISAQSPVFIGLGCGLGSGSKTVVGTDERERSRRGKEFGIRCGRQKLVGIVGVDDAPSVQLLDLHAPETARNIRAREDGIDSLGQLLMLGGERSQSTEPEHQPKRPEHPDRGTNSHALHKKRILAPGTAARHWISAAAAAGCQ